jgi:hypothetical protein
MYRTAYRYHKFSLLSYGRYQYVTSFAIDYQCIAHRRRVVLVVVLVVVL